MVHISHISTFTYFLLFKDLFYDFNYMFHLLVHISVLIIFVCSDIFQIITRYCNIEIKTNIFIVSINIEINE